MTPQPKLAVLIDADNTTHKACKAIFEEIAKLGDATVRRLYGDVTAPGARPWNDKLLEHAIIPQQQFAYTQGKNASDILMVIDAMDLLHRGGLDGFCLVSSDSDFTRLAQRLREAGCTVYGFGEVKTPNAFRASCSRFIFIENLLEPSEAGEAGEGAPKSSPRKEPPSKAVPILRKTIAEMDDDDGWVQLGAIGTRIYAIAPDFDCRTYGCAKLSDLVARTGAFEIERPEGKPIRIREKPQADEVPPEPEAQPKAQRKARPRTRAAAKPSEAAAAKPKPAARRSRKKQAPSE